MGRNLCQMSKLMAEIDRYKQEKEHSLHYVFKKASISDID